MIALGMLFLIFFRVGLFGFGGGYAMLPLIYQAVQTFGLMSPDRFSELVALSQVTPGPIVINAATYVGYQYAGVPGALVATAGVVTPSVILVYLLLRFLTRFRENPVLEGVLGGIRSATSGLLFAAALLLAQQSLLFSSGQSWISPAMFAAGALLFGKWKVNPILLTLLGGALGAAFIK